MDLTHELAQEARTTGCDICYHVTNELKMDVGQMINKYRTMADKIDKLE